MKAKRSKYDLRLDDLAAMLKQEPMSAKTVALVFECCKPAAYQRIAALRARGDVVYEIPIRESVTGPDSIAFGIR